MHTEDPHTPGGGGAEGGLASGLFFFSVQQDSWPVDPWVFKQKPGLEISAFLGTFHGILQAIRTPPPRGDPASTFLLPARETPSSMGSLRQPLVVLSGNDGREGAEGLAHPL